MRQLTANACTDKFGCAGIAAFATKAARKRVQHVSLPHAPATSNKCTSCANRLDVVSSCGYTGRGAGAQPQAPFTDQACLLQAQVLPFTKALAAFVDKMASPDVQPDAATGELNDRSLAKVIDFVKSVAKATNAYPPAMAENVNFVVR